METVRLHRTARVLAGHLWVFSNELASSPKGLEPGGLVEVHGRREAFLGIGYVNPRSLISVRILTRLREEINRDFLRRRIIAARDLRRRMLGDVVSFRAVFSEGDFLPGLIVDKYAGCLVVQVLTLGMERMTDLVLDILDEVYAPSVIVLRNDSPVRSLEGLGLERRMVKGDAGALPVLEEGDLRFEIDTLTGQKTGFFLDQRENRIAFSRLAAGGIGLDLFSYDGAWGLHIAKSGGRVTSVDESEAALSRAGRNADLNGLTERCSFRRADVFRFLRDESTAGKTYDFVVLDPPAFVKSGARVKEALRGYREINGNSLRLLRPGGLLATSSCSYHISREDFLDMLRDAARDAGRQVRLIEVRSQAKDHPMLLSMPETAYLKCAFLEAE